MAKKEKPENMFYLKISDECEVRQVDSRNYQVTVGNKVGFASTIEDALKLLVSRSYEKEIKNVKISQTLKDLQNTLKQAEENILKSIKENIK